MNKYNYSIRLLAALILLIVFNLTAHAQYALLKSADREFDSFNFIKAIELYQQAYNKNPKLYIAERLAESYYNVRNYKEAEAWYAKAANDDKADPESIIKYAEVLRNNSKFREARAQYARYASQYKGLEPGELNQLYASIDSAVYWIENPLKQVEVKNKRELNSAQSDFGATPGDSSKIWFVSDRLNGAIHPDQIYGWTGNPYLGLYRWTKDSVANIPLSWHGENHHVGPPTFNKKADEVYYSVTREPKKNEKRKAGKQVTVNIEIFSSKLSESDWGKNAQPFRFNNITTWSVGDPFLTASGDTLYFSSNKTGGQGGTDIYYVTRTSDGSWSDAVNLGPEINTSGDERFPALDENGTFYFSSTGHVSVGGLDVFKVLKKGVKWKVVNLGYPFNSPQDDFAIRFTKGTKGYFSSNRNGGAGADDIYDFELNKVIQISLEGTVYNAKTNLPVAGTSLRLTPEGDLSSELTINADGKGKFRFNLQENMDYSILPEQTGFKPADAVTFSTKGIDSSTVIKKDIYLQPVEVKEVVVLRNIYFDYDKAEIRPDAALELDKVLAFLNSAPTAKIELSAHTDSRGGFDYNMKLSQKRADSSIEYLVAHGIDRSRLVAKGYGYTKLVNHCGKGVKCSEEEHQLNRRVEFVILEE